MNKQSREDNTSVLPVLMSRETFYKAYDCGRKSGDTLARQAKAERRIGKRVFIYRPALEAYLESMAAAK